MYETDTQPSAATCVVTNSSRVTERIFVPVLALAATHTITPTRVAASTATAMSRTSNLSICHGLLCNFFLVIINFPDPAG